MEWWWPPRKEKERSKLMDDDFWVVRMMVENGCDDVICKLNEFTLDMMYIIDNQQIKYK